MLPAQSVPDTLFWERRAITSPPAADESRVRIGVWDSGVDTSLFRGALARENGRALLRGYDAFKRRQDLPLARIDSARAARRDELNASLMALDDLDGGVDSPAARALAVRLGTMSGGDSSRFFEEVGEWTGYIHGTSVADVALRGNPRAELLIARMEWWHGTPPVPCWSYELARREAASIADLLTFLVQNGARVVNMSWARASASYRSNLRACAPEMPADERERLVQFSVDTVRSVLRYGMAAAPQVLFVASAGNEGQSLEKADQATRFSLPNFLLIGALNRAGEYFDLSNSGTDVTLYANGERVPSALPGGMVSYGSGT